MFSDTIVTPVDSRRLLQGLTTVGASYEQLGSMCGPDGHHVLLRVAALLDSEPPDLGLEDFARALNRVVPWVPGRVSYLLMAPISGWATIGRLALGPVAAGDPQDWDLASFSQRTVLCLRASQSITTCVDHLLATPLGGIRSFGANAIGGRAQVQLPPAGQLYTLTALGERRPSIVITM